MPDDKKHDIYTRLSHAGRAGTHVHGFVNPPVHRGSTVLFPTMAERRAGGTKRLEQYLTYGVNGTPTHWPLENVVAEIEGGTRAQIVSSGLAAVTVPLLAFLSAGDHLLLPDSVYGPARGFADNFLSRMGIERHVVATKVDKLTRAERHRHLSELERLYSSPVTPVSAETGEGLDALWTLIARLLTRP